MQGWAFNLRRPLFKDVRLRRAFNFAFDFEEMNRSLSTGEYHRDSSYFDGIPDFMRPDFPKASNWKSWSRCATRCLPEVFTTPYKNPVGGNPEAVRSNLREATRLLKEAGFEIRDRKLVDPSGQPVSVEILCPDEGNRAHLAVLQAVPGAARHHREHPHGRRRAVSKPHCAAFDFDMTTVVWAQSLSPGNEQREFFGSQAADKPGSRNMGGIKNPAVDALIERIIFAKNRAEQIAACKAMDRVLLWNFYCVPQFNYRIQSLCALGSLQPSRSVAQIRRIGISDGVVV